MNVAPGRRSKHIRQAGRKRPRQCADAVGSQTKNGMRTAIIQALALIVLTAALTVPAFAAETPGASPAVDGFYGGVELRNGAVDTVGVDFGRLASTWGRFTEPAANGLATRRSLVFGGYRFANDLAVEGSFSTADHNRWSLRTAEIPGGGVGVTLPDAAGDAAQTWNADVYTAWSFLHRFSFYGRLGYLQAGTAPSYSLAAALPADVRLREGVNYGLGLRYDVTSALGLRFEYARFPHFAGEGLSGPLPESDQVRVGVQFRF